MISANDQVTLNRKMGLTHQELEKVHHEWQNEHDYHDLGFLILNPTQSPTHTILEFRSDPKDDQNDYLHHGEAADVDCSLFRPQRHRERCAVESRLVQGLETLHEERRVLKEEVEEENSESCIDENIESVE